MQKAGNATERYETGFVVPETGIYRVEHQKHQLPDEVMVLKGQAFPRCAGCNDSVLFQLTHAAPNLYQPSARIIYELPVIEAGAFGARTSATS
ncbi:MAG TPA: hypothetical protein VHN74_18065 [Candidatus Angelobacter sp.]|jgi:hypothetical protein|nr:hypothetical protein [Candidatus Angelobacter sp.]